MLGLPHPRCRAPLSLRGEGLWRLGGWWRMEATEGDGAIALILAPFDAAQDVLARRGGEWALASVVGGWRRLRQMRRSPSP